VSPVRNGGPRFDRAVRVGTYSIGEVSTALQWVFRRWGDRDPTDCRVCHSPPHRTGGFTAGLAGSHRALGCQNGPVTRVEQLSYHGSEAGSNGRAL